jgi:Glycosyl transferase family 2
MTDDEFLRAPIASAPLSVLLLACNPAADIDDAAATWVDFLRQLNRNFEVLLVEQAPLPKPERPPDVAAAIEQPAEVHPLTQRFPEVRVVQTGGRGLGTLLRAGLAEAKEPLVFFTLADAQYQSADLKKLLESIDGVDLVTGVRTGWAIPFWLRVADFCFGWSCALLFGLPVEPRTTWLGWPGLGRRLLASWIYGVHVQDPECTFCLVRRQMLGRMVIQSDGSFAPIELLSKANFFNALLAEAPITFPGCPGRSAAEFPTFFQQASAMFRNPDFGPVFVPQPLVAPMVPALDGGPAAGGDNIQPVTDDPPEHS